MESSYSKIKRCNLFLILVIFLLSLINITSAVAQCTISNLITTNACGGECNGTIEIIASGGSGIYQYSIDSGSTFQACNLFTGVCTGVYNVTINDLNGCQSTSTITVSEFTTITVTVSTNNNAFCHGSCDGTLTAATTGGMPPYTYLWNDGQTGSFAFGFCAGVYYVMVTDVNGCQSIDTGVVSEPTSIIDSTSSINATSCGSANGTGTVYASGGTWPYTYFWNDPAMQSTSISTGLSAGIYTVLVTDSYACTVSAKVAIAEFGGEILTTSLTYTLCNGTCNGTATVNFTCSNSPCSIAWFDGSGASIGQTGTTATGLCAGDYFVQVTNNSGCVSFDQVTINEPSQLNAATTITNTSCVGTCDGSATVMSSGGILPYTYSWSPGGQTTQTITGLCAGEIHTVTVTDSNGCSDTSMITIDSPDTIIFNTAKIDASCGVCDGKAITCVTSGTPPYNYSWINGSTTFYEDSMCAGYHVVTITDANGCIGVDSVGIENISTISIGSGNSTDITCNGLSDGTITIIASGGTPPLEYSINGGGTYQASGNFAGLSAGSYMITIRDSALCVKLGGTLTVNDPPSIFVNVLDTICDNDSVVLGGAYQNTSGTYYDTLLSVNGCDSVVATALTVNQTYSVNTADITICDGDSVMIFGAFRTIAGTYYDSLMTANSCDSIISTTLLVNPAYNINTPDETICDGDSVMIFGTFRTTAGTYYDSLMTANSCDSVISTILLVNPTYNINTPDETICDGDSIMIFGTFRTTAGTYYDSLMTANSCDSVISTTLIVNPLPVITITPSPGVVCNYGDTVMLVAGGAISYIWSPVIGLNTATGDTVLAFPSTDTTYTVIGTNASGCIDSTTVSVQLSTAPPVANFTANTTNVCEGNMVTFNNISTDAMGFSWSLPGGITADTTVQNPVVTYSTAGVFDVTLTALGCSTDSTLTLTGYITVNPAYYINTSDETICDGDSVMIFGVFRMVAGTYYDSLMTANSCDSVISAILLVNPTYNINTPDETICDGDSIMIFGAFRTTAGTYYDSLMTVNSCDSVISTTLFVNPTYNINTPDETICDGDSVMIFGAFHTVAGTYHDSLITANSCDSVISTTLIVNSTYNISLSDNICEGDSVFIGGAWQTTAGTYIDSDITINGCDSIAETTLTVNSVDTITASESICFGDSILLGGAYQTDVGIYNDTYTASNGCDSVVVVTTLSVNSLPTAPTVAISGNQLASNPANAYQWYFYDTLIVGATSQFYTATKTGFYSVMVADANGCWSISDPFWVTVTSINEMEFLSNLNIYPNPNTGRFTLEMKLQENTELSINLYHFTGQLILSEIHSNVTDNYTQQIDLSGYSKGVYFVQISTDNNVFTRKVVLY